MSLRFVGNQLLQTGPKRLLAGVDTASLSIWVRVNPGCNVDNPAGTEIFGDVAGKVSITLTGSSNVQVAWAATNGQLGGGSNFRMVLTPGTSYHVASVWQNGSQNYYLNGLLIHTDQQGGTLGILGDVSSHSFRLGSDSTGTDVTIDEPTLWAGYALTSQDVFDLRDRVVHPEGISPATIALQWSLAGPDGIAAAIKDPGLTDKSASGLDISTISGTSPKYLAGVLSYLASMIVTALPSGKTILVQLYDPSNGSPTAVKSLRSSNEIQQLTLSAVPQGGSFSLSFKGQTTAPVPVSSLPPATVATFSKAFPAGTYRISASWAATSICSKAALFRIYDGSSMVGSRTCDLTLANADLVDGIRGDGQAQIWNDLATVAITSGTLNINLTSPDQDHPQANAIRVENTSTHAVTYLNCTDSSVFSFQGRWDGGSIAYCYGGFAYFGLGSGNDSRYICDPGTIQAALQDLSTIGRGNITVTGNPDNSGPFTVHFRGSLGSVAQPLLAVSDPAVAIGELSLGGRIPSLTINGGASIPLASQTSSVANSLYKGYSGVNFIAYSLPQSAPAVQTKVVDQEGMKRVRGWIYPLPGGYGSSSYYGQNAIPGSTAATWAFTMLPSGIYQVAVTWLHDPTYSSSAVYTVTDADGNVLGGPFKVNQKVVPADFTEGGVGWHVLGTFPTPDDLGITVTLTNGDADPIVCDSARLARTSPDESVVIQPGDVVTFTASDGWATTSAGALASTTALPVINLAGRHSIVPFQATPKTMGVGYNVMGAQANIAVPPYANLVKNTQLNGGVLASDDHGNPTLFTEATFTSQMIGAWEDGSGLGRGFPVYPPGDFVLMWDGPVNAVGLVSAGSTIVVEKANKAIATGTASNKRVYTLSDPIFYGPSVILQWNNTPVGDGTFANRATNLRIYPPGIDPDKPPKFHPQFLEKVKGCQTLRFMDALNTIGGSIRDFSDYITPDRFSYFDAVRNVNVLVDSVAAYTGSDVFFDKVVNAILLVTTKTPHTLNDGQLVSLSNVGTVQFSDGDSRDLNIQGLLLVHPLTPTTFLVPIGRNTSNSPSMTNVLNAGSVVAKIGGNGGIGCIPLADCIELCNEAGTGFWLNLPNAISDDCARSVGNLVASNLAKGLKVRIEYSNEVWNYNINRAYPCALSAQLIPNAYNNEFPGYVHRAGQLFGLFQAEMAKVGRGEDALLMMGTNGNNYGNTGDIITYAKQYGVTFHGIAVAPYLDCLNSLGTDANAIPFFDALTAEQCLDLYEITVEFSGLDTTIAAARSILDTNGLSSVEVVCYEGGPDILTPPGSTANFLARNYGAVRHPRMYWIMLRMLQKLQDAGCTLFNDYALNIGVGSYQWNVYPGLMVPPGTGDPVADAANIANPLALDQVKSEVGGAMARWASLVPSAASTSPKRPLPLRSGYRSTGKSLRMRWAAR